MNAAIIFPSDQISCNTGPVLAGPLFHSSKKKKKRFLVGFDQCFTAWQRKSSKYSNNAATRYSRAGGNGTAMAVPVFEGEKMASLGF